MTSTLARSWSTPAPTSPSPRGCSKPGYGQRRAPGVQRVVAAAWPRCSSPLPSPSSRSSGPAEERLQRNPQPEEPEAPTVLVLVEDRHRLVAVVVERLVVLARLVDVSLRATPLTVPATWRRRAVPPTGRRRTVPAVRRTARRWPVIPPCTAVSRRRRRPLPWRPELSGRQVVGVALRRTTLRTVRRRTTLRAVVVALRTVRRRTTLRTVGRRLRLAAGADHPAVPCPDLPAGRPVAGHPAAGRPAHPADRCWVHRAGRSAGRTEVARRLPRRCRRQGVQSPCRQPSMTHRASPSVSRVVPSS